MRIVFADTNFFIALLNPRDQLHRRAIELRERLHPFRLVTTEMVLTELLNDFCRRSDALKLGAVRFVQGLLRDSQSGGDRFTVLPQTHDQFIAAFAVYVERSDKQWSLTDCASYLYVHAESIGEALTHDKHFEQMGVKALMRPDA